MRTIQALTIIALAILTTSCENDGIIEAQTYVMTERFCATVTVGGFVGIAEKCLEAGDVVVGYKKNAEVVTVRIAPHSYFNEGPPNSASYQEFLDVPSNRLELQ